MSEIKENGPLREIERQIVSAVVFSKDGKILMGRKAPDEGGVYPNVWHIPGGGMEKDENMLQTLGRELFDETGIDLSEAKNVISVPEIRHGESEKTLKDTGEKVLAKMTFNLFEVYLNTNAEDVPLHPLEDLVELKWFTPEELLKVEQIPGGKDFFIEKGYIPRE